MSQFLHIPDCDFCNFLERLVVDVKGKDGIILTHWESDFLASYIGLPTGAFHFTEGRRKAIFTMWQKYGADISLPCPRAASADRPRIPSADPDCCEYLERADGRQLPCNAPAEYCEPGKLRYCGAHAAEVEKALKRRGKSIPLIRYSSR